MHEDHRRRTGSAFPRDGTGERITVTVGAGDLDNRGIGQLAGSIARLLVVERPTFVSGAVPGNSLAPMLAPFCH
jgi:hypothetical protein